MRSDSGSVSSTSFHSYKLLCEREKQHPKVFDIIIAKITTNEYGAIKIIDRLLQHDSEQMSITMNSISDSPYDLMRCVDYQVIIVVNEMKIMTRTITTMTGIGR